MNWNEKKAVVSSSNGTKACRTELMGNQPNQDRFFPAKDSFFFEGVEFLGDNISLVKRIEGQENANETRTGIIIIGAQFCHMAHQDFLIQFWVIKKSLFSFRHFPCLLEVQWIVAEERKEKKLPHTEPVCFDFGLNFLIDFHWIFCETKMRLLDSFFPVLLVFICLINGS